MESSAVRLLEAHTVAVVGGVLPVLVQHHYIRNRQRMPLKVCRMVYIECAVDVLQRGTSSQRRGIHLHIVCLIHSPASGLQAVVWLKTVIAGGIFIAQLVDSINVTNYRVAEDDELGLEGKMPTVEIVSK